jgi:tetratricopeptide (TPR) repeat protein
MLGDNLQAIRQLPEAEEAYRRGLAIRQKLLAESNEQGDRDALAQGYRQLGLLRKEARRWDEVIAEYTKAIQLEPKRWESWSERGFAHLALRQWDESIEDYTKAIKLAPDVHTNWHHRGLAYGELGRWDNVIRDYSELLKRYPNDNDAFHFRAVAYVKLNQPEKAVADLRQAFAKGFKDRDGVKQDDRLAPLRDREDFKKLLAELEARKNP